MNKHAQPNWIRRLPTEQEIVGSSPTVCFFLYDSQEVPREYQLCSHYILHGTQLFILMHVKAVLTLVGGILIHLTLGTLYTASNLSTYVISYLHVVKNERVTIVAHCNLQNMDESMSPWVFALQSLGQVRSIRYSLFLGYLHDCWRFGSKSTGTTLGYDHWLCFTLSFYTLWLLDS